MGLFRIASLNAFTHISLFIYFFFLNGEFWITDGPLEYHRATSGTIRSYLSPLDIMPIHRFRRKANKYGKNPPCGNRTQDLLVSKSYPTTKMPLGYKAIRILVY
ncbi:hypothetical protein Hanom_Chr16g01483791 [Helianthus anomalus]